MADPEPFAFQWLAGLIFRDLRGPLASFRPAVAGYSSRSATAGSARGALNVCTRPQLRRRVGRVEVGRSERSSRVSRKPGEYEELRCRLLVGDQLCP